MTPDKPPDDKRGDDPAAREDPPTEPLRAPGEPGEPLWSDAGGEPSHADRPEPVAAGNDEPSEPPGDSAPSARTRRDSKRAAARPLNLTAPAEGSTGGPNDWDRARAWIDTTSWAFRGAVIILIAVLLMLIIPARGATQYKSAAGFTSLAGFTFLAAALERIAEFALAPWWGLVPTKKVTEALGSASALSPARPGTPGFAAEVAPDHLPQIPPKVGVSGAAALRASTRTAHTSAQEASGAAQRAASQAADDLYVQATRQRPTIILPMAAVAAVLCYCLHLFLLHGLARSGVSNTHLAFVVDGLITGFAIAGGAQPFHDLISNLTTSAVAKKAAAGA